ncbi:MAG: DUF2842 domain-containing protein [Tagaea sp.]|nr:DUF2842 domain-containing protein [Tagaea sp.]
MPTARSSLAFVGLLVFLAVYAMAAVSLGDYLPEHWAADLVYYVVAGFAWVPVAVALLNWGYRTGTR